jgi:hypothetical protein
LPQRWELLTCSHATTGGLQKSSTSALLVEADKQRRMLMLWLNVAQAARGVLRFRLGGKPAMLEGFDFVARTTTRCRGMWMYGHGADRVDVYSHGADRSLAMVASRIHTACAKAAVGTVTASYGIRLLGNLQGQGMYQRKLSCTCTVLCGMLTWDAFC